MPQTKFVLQENDIPTHWCNIVANMPSPLAPVLGPEAVEPSSSPTLTRGEYAQGRGLRSCLANFHDSF